MHHRYSDNDSCNGLVLPIDELVLFKNSTNVGL